MSAVEADVDFCVAGQLLSLEKLKIIFIQIVYRKIKYNKKKRK